MTSPPSDQPAEPYLALRDRLAERVMGWTLASIDWAYEVRAEVWHDADGTPTVPRAAWRPDEDDLQALLLLDCMTELGFDYRVGTRAGEPYAEFSLRRGTARPSGTREAAPGTSASQLLAANAAGTARRRTIIEAALAALAR